MYVLAAHDAKAVLGYSLWNGFDGTPEKIRIDTVSVHSFTKFEMFAFVMLIPTQEYAQAEATRINAILKQYKHDVELFVLPISVLMHQMKAWADK